MPITALFAGLLALLFLVLSLRVIGARRSAKVSIGDGGDRTLQRRARVHGNFAEYVPITLVLMGLAESGGTPKMAVWTAGLLLLAGRLVHAYGVSQEREVLALRVAGMAMTFASIIALASACIGIGWATARPHLGI
jgi:uncharacterized protein